MNLLGRSATAILAISAMLPYTNHAFGQASAAGAAQPAGSVMVAKIDGKLSTKNAKAGDTISAKILGSGKLSDGTEIPKGSKISGKVSTIKSKKDGNGTSMLSFRFDEIDVKGGAAVPVHGVVVAIGPSLAPKDGLGPNSVLGRSSGSGENGGMGANSGRGVGSSNGIDPSTGLGGANVKDEDNIPLGSTMPGVALGRHLDADWTTILQGIKEDIDLDQDVLIKVQLR